MLLRRDTLVRMAKTLLQKRDEKRAVRRLDLFASERSRLRQVLAEVCPGKSMVLFGSLTRRGTFNDASDIDLALFEEPGPTHSIFGLQALLEERMQRRVDLVLLDECRLRDKILREGEVWTT